MAVLDELYIHVGEAHQYYRYFLKVGRLNGKDVIYTCQCWVPGCDEIELIVTERFIKQREIFLYVCTGCYHFDWQKFEEML